VADGAGTRVPDKNTRWNVTGNTTLAKDKPVTMSWNNGAGLTFERVYAVDDRYIVTITQRVRNTGGNTATLYPYSLVAGTGLPEGYSKSAIAHEGPIGYVGEELHEVTYKNLAEKGNQTYTAAKGWIGITEKYFMAALIPQQGEAVKYNFISTNAAGGVKRYQVDTLGGGREIAPGDSVEYVASLFAGAKEVRLLDAYEKQLSIPHFDLAVDFGLYYFLTKPFFYVLSFIGSHVGTLGIAIIIFTIMQRGTDVFRNKDER